MSKPPIHHKPQSPNLIIPSRGRTPTAVNHTGAANLVLTVPTDNLFDRLKDNEWVERLLLAIRRDCLAKGFTGGPLSIILMDSTAVPMNARKNMRPMSEVANLARGRASFTPPLLKKG